MGKEPTIDDILKDVQKKFDVRVGSLSNVVSPVEALTTGNLAIDHLTGVGGLPIGRVTELYGQPSSGKAQPLDALVLTPSGYVKMGELRVGDAVADPLGHPSVVTGVFPQGVQPVYEVAFSDGTSCEATAEHLWVVEVWVQCFGWLPATVTTEQLRLRVEKTFGRPRVRLPRIRPVSMVSTERVPLDPYLLGLLLGDGGMTGRAVLFTTKDEPLLAAVCNLVPQDCEVVPQSRLREGISYRINGLAPYVRSLGLQGLGSAAKFVPEVYKHQPAQVRLAVLQGLMDTDGHASSGQYNAGHGAAEFSSVSEQLALDVAWLARSLGLKVVHGKTKKTLYRNAAGERVPGKDSYRVRIYQTEDIRVFRLPRKLKQIAPGLHTNRDLVSVRHVRDEESQCISVSAPSRMYVTNDFIPTHNTTTALQSAAALQQRIIADKTDERILYLDFEHALDEDYAMSLGLDVEHPTFLLAQPYWLEQGAEAARRIIESGKVRLSIWDSVAEMTPKTVLESEFDRRTGAMERARMIKELLARLTPLSHQHRCAGVFLNHAMEALDMGGGRPGMPPPETTPGGKALKFYASLRMSYKQIKQIKGKQRDALTGEVTDQVIAVDTKVKVTKNKLGNPFREAVVRVRFGRGFDNLWSALQVLVSYKKVVLGAAGYHYFDESKVPDLVHDDMPRSSTGRANIQGEAAVLRFADEHPDWRERLIRHAQAAIAQAGDAAIPDTEPEGVFDDTLNLLGGSA